MKRAQQSGFTLIEVLAAVAVLALVLGATITGASQYASNAGYLREKALASWVARNKLVQMHVATTWPEPGKSNGTEEMAGQEWDWDMEIKETPDPNLRRVDVYVYPPGKRGSEGAGQLIVMSGFLTAKPLTQ